MQFLLYRHKTVRIWRATEEFRKKKKEKSKKSFKESSIRHRRRKSIGASSGNVGVAEAASDGVPLQTILPDIRPFIHALAGLLEAIGVCAALVTAKRGKESYSKEENLESKGHAGKILSQNRRAVRPARVRKG